MRLDHLLSKEHLRACVLPKCWMRVVQEMPISETFVLRWVLKGGISIGRCPALSLAAQYAPGSSLCGWPLAGWKGCRGFKYRVLPFGTLLGPEATGPKRTDNAMLGWRGHGFVLFLIVPAQVQGVHGEYVGAAGCDGVVV